MNNKHNGVNFSRDEKTIERRRRVIERLETQLKKGVKFKTLSSIVQSLEIKDITRIQKEIETLKTRL